MCLINVLSSKGHFTGRGPQDGICQRLVRGADAILFGGEGPNENPAEKAGHEGPGRGEDFNYFFGSSLNPGPSHNLARILALRYPALQRDLTLSPPPDDVLFG